MSERVSRRHTQMISTVRLPTALVAAPTSVLNCQRRHCQRRPSILRYACIFGQAIEQALAICNRAPPSIRQKALLLRSRLGTKLLACLPQGQKHLGMRSLRLQT